MLDTLPDLFEQVIEGIIPPCESVYHGTGQPQARHHDGPAAWIQQGLCQHTTGYRCDPVVQYLLARAARDEHYYWSCNICKIAHRPGRFIPLGDVR